MVEITNPKKHIPNTTSQTRSHEIIAVHMLNWKRPASSQRRGDNLVSGAWLERHQKTKKQPIFSTVRQRMVTKSWQAYLFLSAKFMGVRVLCCQRDARLLCKHEESLVIF